MASDFLLQIKDLKKSYTADNLILKGVNINIRPGEFVGFLALVVQENRLFYAVLTG